MVKKAKVPTTIDFVVDQPYIDAHPEVKDLTVGETIQIPNPVLEDEDDEDTTGDVIVEYTHQGRRYSRTFDSKKDAKAMIDANPEAKGEIVDSTSLPTAGDHQQVSQNELMRKKQASR